MDIAIKLVFTGNCKDSIINSMKGKIHAQGSNLILYGLNIDDFIKNYQQNKYFNLLDIGLVLYTGPLGLFAKKSSGFARIEVTDRNKKTPILNMISDWKIKNDSLIAEDVAFTTKNNRIALIGKYSHNMDSLDFNIALLDINGCSILSQRFAGLSDNPILMRTNLNSKASTTGTNLFKQKAIKKCKPFYTGSLSHPLVQTSSKK